MNVGCGLVEECVLLIGFYVVVDIYCECCKIMLGWKYVSKFIVVFFFEFWVRGKKSWLNI